MNLCISQATLLSTPFQEDISACADAGWTGIEIWLTKLEKHLETSTLESTKSLFQQRNIRPVAASYQGGLLISQGEQRKVHFDHFRKRLELCEALGIGTLLIAADHSPKFDAVALERAVVSLKQAGQWAAGFGVTLALEFRADAVCTNMESAAMLVGACDEPNVGLNLDIFHIHKGSSKFEDLVRIPAELIKFVQLCDVPGVMREAMTDSDRVMPQEGDFHIDPLIAHLKRINYTGYLSLELMNPVLWKMKPTQVAELGLTAMKRVSA